MDTVTVVRAITLLLLVVAFGFQIKTILILRKAEKNLDAWEEAIKKRHQSV